MNSKKRLLITGASGLLGSNLAYALKGKYRVWGLYHSREVTMEGVGMERADILSADSIKNIIAQFDPEAIIHCAAIADVDYCEDHRDLALAVNVAGTKMIVDRLKGSGCKFIYISTDSVYDGVRGNFSETDPVNPPNYYGVTKCKAERESLKHENTLVARTNFIGWNVSDKLNLAEWILDALLNKKPISGFTDVRFCPLYTFELARLLDMAMTKDLKGVYNFAASDSLEKYTFACLLAQRFGLDASLIKPISVNEHAFKARRAKNLSLNTEKLATALDVVIPGVKESLDLFFEDYGKGILSRLNSVNRLAKRRG